MEDSSLYYSAAGGNSGVDERMTLPRKIYPAIGGSSNPIKKKSPEIYPAVADSSNLIKKSKSPGGTPPFIPAVANSSPTATPLKYPSASSTGQNLLQARAAYEEERFRINNALPKNYTSVINSLDRRYDGLALKIAEMSPHSLQHFIAEYFYDPNVMYAMKEFLLRQANVLSDNNVLVFTEFPGKIIGLESDFGKVYLASANDDEEYLKYLTKILSRIDIAEVPYESPPLYVNKYIPRGLTTNVDAVHEYLVGVELNSLRKICPYFVQTFRYETCGDIDIQPDGRITDICTSSKLSYYLSLENVENAITVYEYFGDPNNHQYIYAYIMIVTYAAKIAYDNLKYIHGDYHLGNCLIRNPNKIYNLPISNEISTKMKGCPTNIDFGFASTSNNPWYTFKSSPKSTPMHDLIYHFNNLESRMSTHPNTKYYKDLTKLVKKLNNDINYNATRIWLPSTIKIDFTVDDLISYLFKNFDYPNSPSDVDSSIKHDFIITKNKEYSLNELLAFPELRKHNLQDTLELNQTILEKEEKVIRGLDLYIELEDDPDEALSIRSYINKNKEIRENLMKRLENKRKIK